MAKVLISDPISTTGVQILENSGIEVVNLPKAKKVGFNKIIEQIDGIIVRSGTIVDEELMKKAKVFFKKNFHKKISSDKCRIFLI